MDFARKRNACDALVAMTWQTQRLPGDHPPAKSGQIGVADQPRHARRALIRIGEEYLKQFLSDTRVVEILPIAWQLILRGIILNTRPQKSAKAYQKIWTERGSPLYDITARQAEAMGGRFATMSWSTGRCATATPRSKAA